MLLIFIEERLTDRMLPCNTLLLILQVRKSGSHVYLNVSLGEKVSNKKRLPSS